jgi:hypothetical protein
MMGDLRFDGDFQGIEVGRCPLCPEADVVWINWIPGKTRLYAVTTNGHIVSYCRRVPFVMSTDGKHEYARARLGVEATPIVVHKLVAMAFADKLPEWDGTTIDWTRYEIDHHDGNKKHNCVSNLRVVRKGSQVKLNYVKGERKLKLSPEIVEEIKRLRRQGTPVREIARMKGVSPTRIYQVTR